VPPAGADDGGAADEIQVSRYSSMMEIHQILSQLIQERDQLNEAILSLERLAAGQGKHGEDVPLPG
jgi:hypothetical protein